MSYINYKGNAESVIKKYDLAIEKIESAIDEIENGKEKLKTIVGYNSAEELKEKLREKVSYLRDKETEIKIEKKHICDRSSYLQEQQDRRNEIEEKNNN